MKKIISMLFILTLSFILIGCINETATTTDETENSIEDQTTVEESPSDATADDGKVEVVFDTNGGTLIASIMIDEGDTVTQPQNPEKNGFEFIGWYTDISLTQPYDFSTLVYEDIVLRAKWEKVTLKIGVILPDASEQRWVELDGQAFDDELSELYDSDEFEILYSEGSEYQENMNAEALIAKGVDVIILTAEGSGAGVAELCASAGVVLISHDRLSGSYDTGYSDYYVTFNPWEIGQAQGAHLVQEALNNGCSSENPCDLALFAGRTANHPFSTLLFGGAMEEIQPHLDIFSIINIEKESIESLGYYTETAFYEDDGTIMNKLQEAMASIDTDWSYYTTEYLTSQIISNLGDADKSNEDVYILSPADFLSPAIRDLFAGMEEQGYRNMYMTGQDADDIAVASLMGDPINGHGTQTMTVFKDVNKMVHYSIMIAQNIVDGKNGLEGLNEGLSFVESKVVYAPVDVLTWDDKQKTYDLLFESGYKLKDNEIFKYIDFSVYE